MKTLTFLTLLILPFFAFSQKDTVIYFGVNGNIEDIKHERFKTEIQYKNAKSLTVKSYELVGKKWELFNTEKISIKNEKKHVVKADGINFTGTFTRKFEKLKNGTYQFVELVGSRAKRTGFSLSQIPIMLTGEIKETHENGRLKSVSRYDNNRLVSNKNWLEDGTPYLDNVFYSVDTQAEFMLGEMMLNHHVLNTFKKQNVSTYNIEGNLIVGFVVKADGKIEGVKIEKGINEDIDKATVHAFENLQGGWKPATLNEKDVNYYQKFPINIRPRRQ